MKTLIIAISLITISFSADAQWYYKECQVTDINDCTPEEFECLWNSAVKKSNRGALSILIGSASVVGGVALIGNAVLYSEEYIAAYLFIGTIGTILLVHPSFSRILQKVDLNRVDQVNLLCCLTGLG